VPHSGYPDYQPDLVAADSDALSHAFYPGYAACWSLAPVDILVGTSIEKRIK
jgi:hypothetical protein